MPFVLRLVGIHHLLCDHCNLLFTGFVMPGTLRRRKKHRRHKHTEHKLQRWGGEKWRLL